MDARIAQLFSRLFRQQPYWHKHPMMILIFWLNTLWQPAREVFPVVIYISSTGRIHVRALVCRVDVVES